MKTSVKTAASALLLMVSGWSTERAFGADDHPTSAHSSSEVESNTVVDNNAVTDDYISHKSHPRPLRLAREAHPVLDRSGHTRIGKASFYAHMFAGRTMADGTPM